MKRFFFLPTWALWASIVVLYLSFKLALGWGILTWVLMATVGFLFRRGFVPYRDTIKNDGEIFLSPVYGITKSIRKSNSGEFEIRIMIGLTHVKGLYLPTAGEVTYLKATRGQKIARDADDKLFYGSMDEVSHTDLILTSKNQMKTQLRFIDSHYGIRPSIWLKSGDRGRAAACFGYYPFGGTLIAYLPSNSDILVFENEKLIPGVSVIAAIKDLK